MLASGFLAGAGAALEKTLADADASWTLEHTGPGLMTRVFCGGFLDRPDAVCLPFGAFYGVANDGSGAPGEEALAVHRWARGWQK